MASSNMPSPDTPSSHTSAGPNAGDPALAPNAQNAADTGLAGQAGDAGQAASAEPAEQNTQPGQAEPSAQAGDPANTPPAPEPPPATVPVSINVRPWGEILVDGQPRGVSPPLKQLRLAPGTYTITVRNADLPPHRVTVTVQAGKPVTISHTF